MLGCAPGLSEGRGTFMAPQLILWVYIALLITGGLIGFLKAKSKASLIASLAFAVPLSLCAAGVVSAPAAEYLANTLLGILAGFFGTRFAMTKAFMPGGLMALLSVLALVLRMLSK